jgi:glutamine synthetase
MLCAGLKGVEEEYPVPPPVEGNVFAMSDEEREARGIKTLPGSLSEAIALAEDSALLREALGDHIFNSFIQNKKIEWADYRSTVTDYEVARYLPIL